MQQARYSTMGSGGCSRRTRLAGSCLHDLHAGHAALHCQARSAVDVNFMAQLASRQRHNQHHNGGARGSTRRQQEAAQAGVAGWVVVSRGGRCREGRGKQDKVSEF